MCGRRATDPQRFGHGCDVDVVDAVEDPERLHARASRRRAGRKRLELGDDLHAAAFDEQPLAVSRHQPFGCDSASTSCAGVARESCGRVVSRCTPSCTMR